MRFATIGLSDSFLVPNENVRLTNLKMLVLAVPWLVHSFPFPSNHGLSLFRFLNIVPYTNHLVSLQNAMMWQTPLRSIVGAKNVAALEHKNGTL